MEEEEIEKGLKNNTQNKNSSKNKQSGHNDEPEIGCIQRWKQEYQEHMRNIMNEKEFHAHGKKFYYMKNSLGMLTNRNPLRVACVWIETSSWFDHFILCLIILNSICLGLKDYKDADSKRNQLLQKIDPFFTIIFVIECAIKVIGRGFFFG